MIELFIWPDIVQDAMFCWTEGKNVFWVGYPSGAFRLVLFETEDAVMFKLTFNI
jgi:hypothetical protein